MEVLVSRHGFVCITLPSLCQVLLIVSTTGPTPMDVSTTAQEISNTDVTVLEGHSSEVSRVL
jgi:transducin (beta)-like 1